MNPSYALGYQGYSTLMTVLGRHEEALTAMRRARELDPPSPMVNVLLCCTLYFGGRLQEAFAQARVSLDLDPNFPSGHIATGWVFSALGDLEGSIGAQRSAVRCCPESSLMRLALAYTLAAAGSQNEARSHLQAVIDGRPASWASPYWIASVYTALAESDAAFEWLEVALDECDGWRVYLAIDPQLRPLAHDLRFRKLLRGIGLPELDSRHLVQKPTDGTWLARTVLRRGAN